MKDGEEGRTRKEEQVIVLLTCDYSVVKKLTPEYTWCNIYFVVVLFILL